jgi:hypothetical protein
VGQPKEHSESDIAEDSKNARKRGKFGNKVAANEGKQISVGNDTE